MWVDIREEHWHWEIDTVLGLKNASASISLTLVEHIALNGYSRLLLKQKRLLIKLFLEYLLMIVDL